MGPPVPARGLSRYLPWAPPGRGRGREPGGWDAEVYGRDDVRKPGQTLAANTKLHPLLSRSLNTSPLP